MSEFEKQLKKTLEELKVKYESGQDIESISHEHAERLAELLLDEKLFHDDPKKNPEKSAETTKRMFDQLKDEYNVNDTLIVFRGTEEGRLTGILQGDSASIAAGIGYIIHKSKLPRQAILMALDHIWEDDEKT